MNRETDKTRQDSDPLETEEWLESLQAVIEQQRIDVAATRLQASVADGRLLDILSSRLERQWIELLEHGIDYGQSVVDYRAGGFIVDEFQPVAVAILLRVLDLGVHVVVGDGDGGELVVPDPAIDELLERRRHRDRVLRLHGRLERRVHISRRKAP